jgi:putative FmdB family regulatory protein
MNAAATGQGTTMPIYAYRCTSCGHAQDVLQKISDPLLTVCPACGAAAYEKQVTAAGFQLKGSGWYVTDFRGGNTGRRQGGEEGRREQAGRRRRGACSCRRVQARRCRQPGARTRGGAGCCASCLGQRQQHGQHLTGSRDAP